METLELSKNLIAERAYEIFKSRGGNPGKDLDDWLLAEKELAQHSKKGAAPSFQAKNGLNSNTVRK